MGSETYSFRIEGIAPIGDPQWIHAGPKVRAEFWREVVRLGLLLKDADLAAGKDFEGAKLTPISAYTRKHRRSAMGPAYAYAPPLTPAFELSRTRSLLAGRAHDGYALFFWRAYEGKHWGRILGYHRAGSARLPVRNVIGISDASKAKVERRALKWWDARKASLAPPPGSTPPLTPKSTPIEPAIPRMPITGAEPVEHPGKVVYLPHGTRPSARSTKITVFSTDAASPRVPPSIPRRKR